MSSDYIFSNKQAIVGELPVASDHKTETVAKLKVGNTVRNFLMVGQIMVKQSDRVQVDASADGAMHVVTCKGAVGYCDVQLLDRESACRGNTDFAIKCYTKDMKSLASRKATLTLYPADDTPVEFSGVITGATVQVLYDKRILHFLTTLHLMGSWD